MDEYSLWLQTNVSSARQDHVRAFADDLGDLPHIIRLDCGEGKGAAAIAPPPAGRLLRALEKPDNTPEARDDLEPTNPGAYHVNTLRPPVGVGERARCPARFQRSRPCPHPRNEPPTNLHAERSPALDRRRRSRPSSRGSWGRHFHYSSKETQLDISRRTRRCPRAPTPRASRAT